MICSHELYRVGEHTETGADGGGGARDWREGGMGDSCLLGIGCYFGLMRVFWN